MKNILKFILLSFITIIIASIFCILLFHTPLLKSMHVLMYRGIFLIIITSIILFIALVFISKKSPHICDIKDAFCITILFISINMVFFTLVPVTVERSVSVFTLSQIEELPDNTITKSAAEDMFNNVYVYKNDAFGKRFDEQIVTGTLKKNSDGSYTLTKLGHFVVKFFRIIGKLYNADCKNLY